MWTSDFETTTDEEDCRVWAYAFCSIDNPDEFLIGNTIEGFFNELKNNNKIETVAFHNLKFDGEFIIYYLLKNNYQVVEDFKELESNKNCFYCVIDPMGAFYSIIVKFDKKQVKIIDSLKLLNFSVENIAKDFGLPLSKLKIDYKAKREKGHILTMEEIEYIKADVKIMSLSLKKMYERKLNKITIASCALDNFKKTVSFNTYFPVLTPDEDIFIRKSYKGGFTFLNEVNRGFIIKNGIVLDKNSMYPAKMYNEEIPIGNPIYFTGKYQKDPLYNLYVQHLKCEFNLKFNKIPSIQLKNNFNFRGNEYLTSSSGLQVDLYLTNVDLELFMTHYNLKNVEYIDGYKFKSQKGLFRNYIDNWTREKINSKKQGNKANYLIAKLMLNSLYGKFGLSRNATGKIPVLIDDVVHYPLGKLKERDGINVAVASFITSYARKDIIEASQKIRDWSIKKYNEDFYIYSDTDSLHIKIKSEEDITDLSKILDIDDFKLGAWKLESRFKRGKFLRQKCYIEEDENNKLNITIAGFPKTLAPIITFDNFEPGFNTENMTLDNMIDIAKKNGASEEEIEKMKPKLRYKHVKGGIILEETPFTIK